MSTNPQEEKECCAMCRESLSDNFCCAPTCKCHNSTKNEENCVDKKPSTQEEKKCPRGQHCKEYDCPLHSSPTTQEQKSFSDFIRNASPEEKEKVYMEVIDESIEDQKKTISTTREGWEEMFKDEFKAYFTPEEMVIVLDVVDTIVSSEIDRAKREVVEDILEYCTHWGNGVKMVDEDTIKDYARSKELLEE